ncbi:unnamed protein product [Urochloa humidicola]
MPRLPQLPITILLPTSTPSTTRYTIQPVLMLTWRADCTTAAGVPASPAPSPTPAPSPMHTGAGATGNTGGLSPPAPHRRGRRAAAKINKEGTRNSKRLAAKDSGKFVKVADKASQLKALHDSLLLCSKPVQIQVTKKKMLKKTKKPIADSDLIKLADAVGLGEAAAAALDRALDIGAATGRELDLALARQI